MKIALLKSDGAKELMYSNPNYLTMGPNWKHLPRLLPSLSDSFTNPVSMNFEEGCWFYVFWFIINIDNNIHFHVTNSSFVDSWFVKPSDEQVKSHVIL